MIAIDGNKGGGQLLRTSLALSALTGQPFRITEIRSSRNNPGLQEQHLQAVKAVKRLCNAEISGDFLHSKEITFNPGKITKKQLRVEVKTAGSTSLILQTLFLASLNNNLDVRIKGGGTWNLFAPSILYLQEVFLPLMIKFGMQNRIEIIKNGFYPKGNAIVESKINKTKLSDIEITSRGSLEDVRIVSIASEILKKSKVAARQMQMASNLIGAEFPEIALNKESNYVPSLSPGSGILCKVDYENTIIGFDVPGQRGKQSEMVGKEAAEGLLKVIDSFSTVDPFMLDQILPFMALKGGSVKFLELTEHAKTNIGIIEKFLDVKFKVKKNTLSC